MIEELIQMALENADRENIILKKMQDAIRTGDKEEVFRLAAEFTGLDHAPKKAA